MQHVVKLLLSAAGENLRQPILYLESYPRQFLVRCDQGNVLVPWLQCTALTDVLLSHLDDGATGDVSVDLHIYLCRHYGPPSAMKW